MSRQLRKVLLLLLTGVIGLIALAGPAHAYVADDRFDVRNNNGTRIQGSVDWVTDVRLEMLMKVTDRPGDAYCTFVHAAIYDVNDNQIGNWINFPVVCGGQTLSVTGSVPKAISTATGRAIDHIHIDAHYGSGSGMGGAGTGVETACYARSELKDVWEGCGF